MARQHLQRAQTGRKTKAADAIKGAVMRETKGMARMEVVQQLVMEELGKA